MEGSFGQAVGNGGKSLRLGSHTAVGMQPGNGQPPGQNDYVEEARLLLE